MYLVQMETQIKQAGTWTMDCWSSEKLSWRYQLSQQCYD